MKNLKVAFVIVGWNNKDLVETCIGSIKEQSYQDIKIVFVDNNSSDGSTKLIKDRFHDVELVEMKENTGFAKGNNIGIRKALEDPEVQYIGLLNTDATLSENWTETILEFAKMKPKGAAFQTITLDYYDHDIIDSTHIYIAHNGQATQGSWRRRLLEGKDVAPQKVFGCNAAAVMYSRRFIEEQPFDKFFDEKLFMYLEDVDVAARATVTGWDNYVVPGARAYHMGSASSSKNPGFSLYMTFRNNTAVLFKNLHIIVLIRMLPKLVRGDIDTLIVLWRTKRKKAIWPVIKGRLVGVFRCILFVGDRLKLRSKISYKQLWALMFRGC